MKLSNKTILILFFMLCGVIIASVQKSELNIEMLMENTESREVVIINARVTSIPFKRYFVKGTISMKNRVFQIYRLEHIMTPRENEHIYMILFRELDHKGNIMEHIGGEMSLTGDVMRNIVYRNSPIIIHDALQDKIMSYEVRPINSQSD